MSLTISRLTIFLLLFLSFLLSPNATRAQQFSYSPTIPLAVRSPYLNCWLQYNRSSVTATLGHIWPTTSNFSQVCHPNISYGHEISQLSLSDPRVVCPGTCRQPDVFVPGGYRSESCQRYCKLDILFRQPFKHYSHWAGWANASKFHIHKSYRGSFSLLC
jgi:hypothetical protein